MRRSERNPFLFLYWKNNACRHNNNATKLKRILLISSFFHLLNKSFDIRWFVWPFQRNYGTIFRWKSIWTRKKKQNLNLSIKLYFIRAEYFVSSSKRIIWLKFHKKFIYRHDINSMSYLFIRALHDHVRINELNEVQKWKERKNNWKNDIHTIS